MFDAGAGRRAVYFAFQGLFVAVLLLIFLFVYRGAEGWAERFSFLIAVSLASLLALQSVREETLGSWYFQVALFMGDAAAASLVLSWTTLNTDLYLIYFFIIFGTALLRSLTQSLIVAAVTSILYFVSAWNFYGHFPDTAGFWLRINLLWVSSILLAILSRDSRQAQRAVESRHQERLAQFERLATLGQMAGEVAHRIKGPLTTIMVNAEVLSQRGGLRAEAQKEIEQIRTEVGHCRDILKGLLDLGRIEEMDEVSFDLRGPLRQALAAVSARLQGFDPMAIHFIRRAHEAGLGIGDPQQIRIVGYDIDQEPAWGFVQEDTFASRGQRMIYHGWLKPLEKLLLQSPLVPWSYFASNFYHNVYWYPFVGRRRVREALRTRWGRLFRDYGDGQVVMPGMEPKTVVQAIVALALLAILAVGSLVLL